MREEYNFCDDCVVHTEEDCMKCYFNRELKKEKKANDLTMMVAVIVILILFIILMAIGIEMIKRF